MNEDLVAELNLVEAERDELMVYARGLEEAERALRARADAAEALVEQLNIIATREKTCAAKAEAALRAAATALEGDANLLESAGRGLQRYGKCERGCRLQGMAKCSCGFLFVNYETPCAAERAREAAGHARAAAGEER